MKNIYRLISFLSLIYYSGNAQNAAPNPSDYTKIIEVLPPSPNAASLGKYGGLDLSLASGMVNVSIPIYELSSIDLKIPISLAYSGNGFRVDELAGRVGSGWSLNAGGVITRTVYGVADEYSSRASRPADFPSRTQNLINYMDGIADESAGIDGQPDLFSFNFNGYTGQFILDDNLSPVLLSHSNLKVEKDLSSSNWNFKITTGDGVQYFFGGDLATETTKKSSSGTGCGKSYNTFVPTSWYLKKIAHPNRDTITLTYASIGTQYSTGTSETLYLRNESDYSICSGDLATNQPPVLSSTSCETVLQTTGVLLQEITTTGGARVSFDYMDRNDGNDKLCIGINVYQPGQVNKFKFFKLNYQSTTSSGYTNVYSSNPILTHRYFLTDMIEESSDSALTRKYAFTYNDVNSLPPRLSYAQDHYGFFNGKDNSTTQVPLPSTATWRRIFPQATADRNIDPMYAQKGMLSSVIYPTGGKDTILYEANQVYKAVTTYSPETSVGTYVSNSGPGGGTTVYSSTFTISMDQVVRFVGSCSSTSSTGGDPIHDQTMINILDELDNSVYSNTIAPGSTFDVLVDLSAVHTYRVKLQASGEVECGSTLYYTPGTATTQLMNVNTGGLRVAKIITIDPLRNVPIIKKYLYNRKDNASISSGAEMYVPVYEKYMKAYWPCLVGTTGCVMNHYGFYSMYSNTQNNLYSYSSSPVSYANVFESEGDNFDNGGVEHDFTVESDKPAHQLCCNDILIWGPQSSYSWKNAREIYQKVFKKSGATFIPVKEVLKSYKEDTRIDQEFKGYFANKKYNPTCGDLANDATWNAYDLYEFSYFRKWVYVDTITVREYDTDGQAYIENKSASEYGNPTHAMLTKQTTFASDGSTDVVQNYYAPDLILTGNEETGRQALVAKNMIGLPMQQIVTKDNTQVVKTLTGYNVFSNGLVLASSKSLQIRNAPIESRVSFNKYDPFGRIVEQSKSDDVLHTSLWDYNSMYVIADCVNVDSASIAYTSFEADGSGNWIVGSSLRDTAAFTGRQSYNVFNGVSVAGLASGKSYDITYWSKSGAVNLLVGGDQQTAPEAVCSRNGWTLYRHNVFLQTGHSIGISGNTVIDELRLYPTGAKMTTYTYTPLVGMTSQCDPNNRVSYYEYDGLGRLKLIRDQNRNAIKTFEYQYQANTNQ